MLDLNFVRNNLPFVEEKLRARSADPAELLGDFHAQDARRREAITRAAIRDASPRKRGVPFIVLSLGRAGRPVARSRAGRWLAIDALGSSIGRVPLTDLQHSVHGHRVEPQVE